jgi:S-adenosylmethionine/arginine decarboxylase-like enzyme
MKNGNPLAFPLNDYEHFYLKKRNIVYIKVPTHLDNINKLKDDTQFCSAIAETFSAILDVDAQRQFIRELFSKSSSGRDELIRAEIDDNNLEKLNEAKVKLGVINNPKFEFWKAYIRCFKGKTLKNIGDTDNCLLENLIKILPKFKNIIENVFSHINYDDINEDNSSELIVTLFKESGIFIKTFNEYHYPSLDISQLYKINFRKTIQENLEKFKSLYYKKCILNSKLQSEFRNVIDNFNNISHRINNEVDFDTNADLLNIIREKYDVDISDEYELLNWDNIININQEKLWLQIDGVIDSRSLLDQFFRENITAQSLIYFDEQIVKIESIFKEWLGKNKSAKTEEGSISKSNRISFRNQAILYDDLADLKNQVKIIIDNEGLKNVTSINIKISKSDIKTKSESEENTKNSNTRIPKVPKEEIGFLGEYLVYLHLLDTIDIKDNVKWVSAYAKDCGVNQDGRDGCGYDIEYTPNGAKYPRYVEVKVVGGDDAFRISSNEVKVGERLKKHYEIFLVRNIDSSVNVKIEKIQGLFDYKGKSFTENDLFSVINDNFILKFKKIE